MKATIHALANGKPMCGRAGQPASWPPGERWVSAYDETGAWALDPAVTCPKCQYRLLARVGALVEARQQIPAARVGAAPDGPTPPPAYVCPTCGRASWNPNDAKHGYCGACGFQVPPRGDGSSVVQALAAALRESLGLDGGCGSCEMADAGRDCDRCERARALLRAIEGP